MKLIYTALAEALIIAVAAMIDPVWLAANAPWVAAGSIVGLVIVGGVDFGLKRLKARKSSAIANPIPFPFVLRHLGHGSQWSISKCNSDPSLWQRVVQRELLDHLARGNVRARGLWRGMEDGDNALRNIKKHEWAKLSYPTGPMTERALDFVQAIGPRAGMYRFVELDRDQVFQLWPKWSRWVRLKRRFFGEPLSLAERTGEIELWRKHNDETPTDDDYYWRES